MSNDIDNDNYLGSGLVLLKAIIKNGRLNFHREILHSVETKLLAYKLEKLIVTSEFIKRLDTYNIKLGGIGGFPLGVNVGRVYGLETRARRSKSLTGILRTDETKKNISKSLKGRTPWNIGIPKSLSAKLKYKISRTGTGLGENNPFYGMKHSLLTLQKLRKPKTTLHKEKLKSSRTYTSHSDLVKKKISLATKAYWNAKRLEGLLTL